MYTPFFWNNLNDTSTIKSNTIETIQEEINQSKLQTTQEELEMQQSLQKDMTETELDIRNIELKIRNSKDISDTIEIRK